CGGEIGPAAVVPLEVQPGGRDQALERLQRRARGTTARRAGLRADERACHLAFVLGGAAVLTHPGAGLFHRRRDIRRLARAGVFRSPCPQTAGRREQANALLDEAAFGFVHRGSPGMCAVDDSPLCQLDGSISRTVWRKPFTLIGFAW